MKKTKLLTPILTGLTLTGMVGTTSVLTSCGSEECPVTNISFEGGPKHIFKGYPVVLAPKVNIKDTIKDPEKIAKLKKLKFSIVSGKEYATINEQTGLLTPTTRVKNTNSDDPTVTVKAESTEYSNVSATCEIEINESTLQIQDGVCSGFYQEALNKQGTSTTSGPIYDEFGNTLRLPDSVTSIAAAAFKNVDGTWKLPLCIRKLNFNQATNLKTIGDEAFAMDDAMAILKGSITSIDLSNCSNLESIGTNCFDGCLNCASILLPENAPKFTEIKTGTFQDCCSLTNLTIPKSVTSIGGGLFNFSHINNLLSVTFADDSARWTMNGMKLDVTDPARNKNYFLAYKSQAWTKSAFTQSGLAYDTDGLKTTVSSEQSSKLTDVEIPAAVYDEDGNKHYVTNIGKFQNVASTLTDVYFPSHVREINDSAFYGCNGLTTIDLSNCSNLTRINNNAFYEMTKLNNVVLPTKPNDVAGNPAERIVIGSNAFYKKEPITASSCSLEINSPIQVSDMWWDTSISEYSFTNCKVNELTLGQYASIYEKQSDTTPTPIWKITHDIGGAGLPGSIGSGGLFATCKALYIPIGETPDEYFTTTLGFKLDTSTKQGYNLYTR